MANAAKDKNGVSTKIAVLNTNGITIGRLKANPVNHGLKINDGTTGSDNGPVNAKHDDNYVPTMLALSSADGETIVTLYCDINGALLIKST